ncbi:MAG: putative sulfate exporter family transporter [Acetobacteraceae bacterium]|nr:putative sulfate exporter family transporter [Acetobacteraceae bacterium]
MAQPENSTALPAGRARYIGLAPGVAVCFIIALIAIWVRDLSGAKILNPVAVALIIGIALRAAIGMPATWRAGTTYVVRPVLRTAIVILGLQVTLSQLLSVGPVALGLAVAAVGLTIVFTIWLGARLGVDAPMAMLLGTGTGICGASAIVAASQVAGGKQEDVAYALAVITLCGTISVIVYPYLGAALGLSAHTYGIWAGASVHEVVQAVAAAGAWPDPGAVEVGTITKLARVVLLTPAVIGLGYWAARSNPSKVKTPVPWFAFGFIALVVLGDVLLWLLPAVQKLAFGFSRLVVPIMLSASVAALGLGTDLKALKEKGAAPLALGVLATIFIALLGLIGARLV